MSPGLPPWDEHQTAPLGQRGSGGRGLRFTALSPVTANLRPPSGAEIRVTAVPRPSQAPGGPRLDQGCMWACALGHCRQSRAWGFSQAAARQAPPSAPRLTPVLAGGTSAPGPGGHPLCSGVTQAPLCGINLTRGK